MTKIEAKISGVQTVSAQVVGDTIVATVTDAPDKIVSGVSAVGPQGAAGSTSWDSLTGKPSTFPPSAHQHIIGDTVGLQAALDGKQAAGTYATLVDGKVPTAQLPPLASSWNDLSDKPSTFAPAHHSASHAANGSDPVTIAASQLAGGSLPSNAVLDFSSGTTDSEVGGWGFGVELTADNAQYATVEYNAVTVHNGSGGVTINATGITFPDGTQQPRAYYMAGGGEGAIQPTAGDSNGGGTWSTIGGGNSQTATGTYSTIAGGTANIANGFASAVLGGESNDAAEHQHAMMVGSHLAANADYTTFVNNLTIQGAWDGSGYVGGSITLPNSTQVTVGSFDNSTGGANGISLICSVGYELNWQGGRLRNVQVGGDNTPQTIYSDSQLAFPGGAVPVRIDSTGITFADGSTQTAAAPALPQSLGQTDNVQFASVTAYGVSQPSSELNIYGLRAGTNSSLPGTNYYNDGITFADSSFQDTAWTGSVDWATQVANKPTLFSGAYADLTGKPTLGTAAAANTGDFAAASHTHALSSLTQSGASSGQVATWNGSAWAAATPATYSLPDATTSIKGGVIVGAGLSVSSGTISVTNPRLAVNSDTVDATSYIGQATPGSATSASVWKIRKTVFTSSGTVSSTTTATNVRWDDRLTATYS